ncbi:hypothetical protein J31TS6_62740 [Brevibacillus reuszeri]|uniref:P-loop NTPase fold protein n=1 Tax=Brevibacillus reuszeri TaxID=54915 RepID=UPI001B19F4E0|nr:P-loop NTPase fold protein [Brevibacillus reuszeri]GIO10246.1 hypothetical protein J31TS6_62740 [Brevibacillus reuszeri]
MQVINMRQTLTRALASLMVSIIIFYPLNPKYIIYAFVMLGVWVILLINYQLKKNSQFIYTAIIFCIANLMALVIAKQFIHHTLHKDWFNITICIVHIFVYLAIFGLCIYFEKKRVINQVGDFVLFNRRRYDLERIKKYIETEDIVGVNGIWGSGKSFLITQLKRHLNETGEYIFIDVDLLSCNLDEIQTILLNEMERVLYEHKIMPTYSTKLKRLLHENVIYRYVYMLLMRDHTSYSEALTGFMQEISLLNKTIVVVYEDIDRITNVDIVKKIFCISEKLASKNIKIIYQYEVLNLQKLGLERGFLEKYIPFVVNLTPIKFKGILENVFQEQLIDQEILKVEDLNYLVQPIRSNYYLEKVLGISQTASFQMDYVSIRKVKNFVKELVITLKEKELYNNKEYKRIAINFYVIKHFFTSMYDQFNLEKGLLETIKFEYNDSRYTILELIAMRKIKEEKDGETGLSIDQLIALFEITDNKEKLFILNLFEYNLEIEDSKKGFQEIVNEPLQNITRKASNEKKNRLIWNLLCNGKSEYTNYEVAAEKLINHVFSQPKEKQKKAYEEFLDEMYYGKNEKTDNTTIFFIGIPHFISIAQALRVSSLAEENWKQFINFYFEYAEKKEIDLDLIQILNYCSLDSKEVYINILNRFNDLEIIRNMNVQQSYKLFLKNYLQALSSLGYVDTPELWMLDVPEEVALGSSEVEIVIEGIKSKIAKMRDKIDIEVIQMELDSIITFMNKNIEIVNCEQAFMENEPKIHSEVSSKFIHQQEFDRLAELQRTVDKEQFKKELEESYRRGCIFVYEVKCLMEQNSSESC